MSAVVLGLCLDECDSIYPRTRDGRCQGCGTMTSSEAEHRDTHAACMETH